MVGLNASVHTSRLCGFGVEDSWFRVWCDGFMIQVVRMRFGERFRPHVAALRVSGMQPRMRGFGCGFKCSLVQEVGLRFGGCFRPHVAAL